MTINEALDFIHSVSWLGSKPGLSRTFELLELLGNPQNRLRFVHIAGTNGKGSTAAMLSSILTAAGYKTGLYSSPYISCFNERMQVNGVNISDDALCEITEKIAPLAVSMQDSPTEFELVTALAFEFFAQSSCDIVVLETGMGGRLDSTNVIGTPDCAVITNIGLDHTRELGNKLHEIAAEKCGIIKHGGEIVLYSQTADVEAVVSASCAEQNATLHITNPAEIISLSDNLEGQKFSYRGAEYRIPLLGSHQLSNAACALEAVEVLRTKGWEIPQNAVELGLQNTFWVARFELVSREPYFIVDGGHNPQGAGTVAGSKNKYFPNLYTVVLVGVLADKNYAELCDILAPCADAFVAVAPDHPRALPAQKLAQELNRFGKPVTVASGIPVGVKAARALAGKDGLVIAVGSLYLAGDVRSTIISNGG